MTRNKRLSLAAITLALPVLALAQTPAPPATPKPAPGTSQPTSDAAFKRADANGDNKLSKAEAARMPAVAAKFDELDKDKDGFLSMDELVAAETK